MSLNISSKTVQPYFNTNKGDMLQSEDDCLLGCRAM
jgi:hypothetical protein